MDARAIPLDDPSPHPRRPWRQAARTLLSLLLGGVAIVGAIALVRQGLVPLVERLFHPAPPVLGAIRRLGIFAAALGGYWLYVRGFERRRVHELRLRPGLALLGGAGGALMIGLPIAALFALGAYQVVLVRGVSPALWRVAALIAIAATLEELVYRALLLRVLERALGTGMALVSQAALFALPHLGNLSRGNAGDVVALFASCMVLGMLWGLLFVLTRNLWAGVGHHAMWNFTILLGGVPLSGIGDWRALAPLQSRYAGAQWLTGGAFGPESSLLVLATSALALAWLWRLARRRGCFLARRSR